MRGKRKSSNPNSGNGGLGHSQRQLRVGERIRHILSNIMRDETFLDPALENAHLISVTAVDVSPDLKNAMAFVMPLGGKNAPVIIEALNRAAGFFRSQVAPELELRHTPKISFRIDNSFDEAERVSRLLGQERVVKDLQRESAEEDSSSDA